MTVTETFEFLNGTFAVHPRATCEGPCPIHRPSLHPMVEEPMVLRGLGMFDITPPLIERQCKHGVGHPDPDSVAYWRARGQDVGVHGCDGCCSKLAGQSSDGSE